MKLTFALKRQRMEQEKKVTLCGNDSREVRKGMAAKGLGRKGIGNMGW